MGINGNHRHVQCLICGLHLGLEDAVPDEKTVWLFRERLRKAELVKLLFAQFGAYLNATGYQAQCGQIVDTTLVPVPKQRNTRDENAEVKAAKLPEDWPDKCSAPLIFGGISILTWGGYLSATP